MSAFINNSPEQCFLVIGTSTGPGIYSNPGPGINDFALHVDGPFRVFGTTMEYTPYLPVKPLTRPHRVPNTGGFTGTAIGTTSVSQFWAQIVMWNPDVFPGNPEQWSGGIVVTVWDDGTSTAVPFGDSNNIEIDHELVRGPDGRVHVRFPFEIGGL